MIAAIGLSFPFAGSASTRKFSRVVAPNKYNDSFGPKKTEQVCVSFNSGSVNNASPSRRRLRRPSANITSLECIGLIPMDCSRSSGIKLWNAPVSTQKSSSKKSSGLDGLETFTCTLNIPIAVSRIKFFCSYNVTKMLAKINEAFGYQFLAES